MKVVFHPKFTNPYTHNPAAGPGRIEPIVEALKDRFALVEPEPATDEDLELVHSKTHIERVKREPRVYQMARLAAGGAIESARGAFGGEASFAVIRPPGHHASPDSCWGFCYFNNVAIAIRRLLRNEKIERAFVLDFDLHYGDGTENAFRGSSAVAYHHPEGAGRKELMEAIVRLLQEVEGFDILAVSAGFDRHEDDWGGTLTTEGTTGPSASTSERLPCGFARGSDLGCWRGDTTTRFWV